jgi:hypothetical protein
MTFELIYFMGILYSMRCNIIHWGLGTGSAVVPEEGTDPVPETQRIKYQYDGKSP